MTLRFFCGGGGAGVVVEEVVVDAAVDEEASLSSRGASPVLNGLDEPSSMHSFLREASPEVKIMAFRLGKLESSARERFNVSIRGDVAAVALAAADIITISFRKSTARAPRPAGAPRRWPCRPTRSLSEGLWGELLERRKRGWP